MFSQKRLEHRLQRLEVLGLGAHHGVEPAFLGLLGRARQRRIDQLDALGREVVADARAGGRLGGGGVDHDQALAAAFEQAVLAVNNLFDLGRARDADEHDVAGLRAFGVGFGFLRAGGDQVGQVVAVAVDLEGQAEAFGQQVFGHAVAHHADADKSDFGGHLVSVLFLVVACLLWFVD
jgi:hypothetical protein